MTKRNRSSYMKREREQKKRDRQQKKAEKAAHRRERRLQGSDTDADPLADPSIPASHPDDRGSTPVGHDVP